MLYICCALTVVIETAFFALLGYWKEKYFLILCPAVNVATNLSINLILSFYFEWWLVAVLEVMVVAAEYSVYAAAYGRSKKLFALTLAANIVSFTIGFIMFCNELY